MVPPTNIQPNHNTCPICGLFHQCVAPDRAPCTTHQPPQCLAPDRVQCTTQPNTTHCTTPPPPPYFNTRQVSLKTLQTTSIPIEETTYLALGGGLGSFAWVDHLRVCGASINQTAVIGRETIPYARFRRLCRASQITDTERLRSDSGARLDNLWGWPGYALHEIVDLLWRHKWPAAAQIAWQIFTEPTLAHTYTPTAQAVYKSIDREMNRIGWSQMFRQGDIRALRQTDDGRYVVLYQPLNTQNQSPRFLIAPYLHLSLGYPGIRLTPELQRYRCQYNDTQRVVQAYENHEHLYAQLSRHGGLVILRGRGIVASRILHHLDQIRRRTNHPIQIIHLLRTPETEETTYGRAHRRLLHHRHVQPFNWPKSAFGGELRALWEQSSPDQRRRLAAIWGGTTTSDRPDWLEVIQRGLAQGWYTCLFGEITEIKPNGRHRLTIKIREHDTPHTHRRLIAHYLIDCTGLNTAPTANPILADLENHYHIPKNQAGHWHLTPNFELLPLRNGPGHLFAAGINTAGNTFPPADSFLGLQYAAQRAIQTLIQENAPNLHPLKGKESVLQWWRWVSGKRPR